MKKVTMYFFEKFAVVEGVNIRSSHPGTLEAIARAKGEPLMDTGFEIDEAELDGNGFQKTVEQN